MSIRLLCPAGHPVVVAASRLGTEVVCPRCLAIFLAEMNLNAVRHARAEKGKASRPRDDDDDDEDEKPVKKGKPSKAGPAPLKNKAKAKKAPVDDDEDEEEDEKPRKKAKAKKAEDDEDEDDDEEEKPEEEPEAPIEWTARKRQLNVCSHGLLAMMIGFYFLMAFTVFSALSIDYYEMVEDPKVWRDGPAWYLFYVFSVPFLYLATVAFMACMVISFFAVPAKAEARGGAIATLVFGALVFFLGLLLILSMTGAITADDESRQRNMTNLLVGGSLICFAVCLMSAMGYQGRLFAFMKMHLEANQPIPNAAFALLVFTGLLIMVTIVSPMAKDNIGEWTGYIIALAADGVAGFGIYMLVVQAKLIQRLRDQIRLYIKDEIK